jgi:hypothetical protein
VRIEGALRLYPAPGDDVRVAADLWVAVGGDRQALVCHHLEHRGERLRWVERPEGSLMTPISLNSFIAWLAQDGLNG